jgi:WD40-like Beta Propeller Repeat
VSGTWTPPRNAGPGVNSGAGESAPMFSADGKSLYFVSELGFATYRLPARLTYRELEQKLRGIRNGMGNIYRVDAAALPSVP